MRERFSLSTPLILCLLSTSLAAAPIGSYTFNFNGKAPNGAKIRITAKGSPNGPFSPTPIDETLSIDGLDQNQVTNLVNTMLMGDGVTTQPNGMNSLMVMGITQGGKNFPISQVDGGSNLGNLAPQFDGNVKNQKVEPGAKFAALFQPGGFVNGGVTVAGALALTIAGEPTVSTQIATGTTADTAASDFYQMLLSANFPDAQLSGDTVTFSLDPFGSPITDITALSFNGANLDVGLGLPATIPEPGTFALIVLAAGALATYLRTRRRATKARPL
jgi:hypothetical protein